VSYFQIATNISSFLVVLLIVVVIHELGHYLVARFFGVHITVFSVGFGKELFGFTDRHQTRWRLSAIPLGGYVRMFGDRSIASQTDHDVLQSMPMELRSKAFAAKPLYAKSLIVLAGPVANLLLTIFLLIGIFSFEGKNIFPPIVGGLLVDGPAAKAGLQVGDRIISVNNIEISDFKEISRYIRNENGQSLSVRVERDSGKIENYNIAPIMSLSSGKKAASSHWIIGIEAPKPQHISLSVSGAFIEAVTQTTYMSKEIIKAIGQLVSSVSGFKQLSGPITMAEYSGKAAREGFIVLLWYMAIISVNLGIFNLLPIPVLDGGHLLIYALNAVRRRPLSPRVEGQLFKVGLVVLAVLMIVSLGNDVFRLN
jgi:regulator of sigma E protease